MPRTAIGTGIAKLRQLRLLMISRAATAQSTFHGYAKVSGSKRLGNVSPIVSTATHPVSAAADQTLAVRKNGLKAIVQMANGSLLVACTAGIAMLHLPVMFTKMGSLSRRARLWPPTVCCCNDIITART